jgi:hypothetical protein
LKSVLQSFQTRDRAGSQATLGQAIKSCRTRIDRPKRRC